MGQGRTLGLLVLILRSPAAAVASARAPALAVSFCRGLVMDSILGGTRSVGE
jgi:hypothetical protein